MQEPKLVLLGDSTIDNTPYTSDKNTNVATQLSELIQLPLHSHAVDGNVMADVQALPLDDIINPNDYVVLSVGGNDLLEYSGQLQAARDLNHAFDIVNQLEGRFIEEYSDLAYSVSKPLRSNSRLLLVSPYGLCDNTIESELLNYVAAPFCLRIQEQAQLMGANYLNLRPLNDNPENFFNAIELNEHGGAVFAGQIADWLGRDVTV